MKIGRPKILSAAALAFMVSWNCNGQAPVYSQGIYSAGVTYWGDHCIGSAQCRFGYSEYSYSTDAQGYTIWVSPDRAAQPGDTFHRRTEIYLGAASFSVPIRPLPFLLTVCVSFLAAFGLGDMGLKYLRRRRETRAP